MRFDKLEHRLFDSYSTYGSECLEAVNHKDELEAAEILEVKQKVKHNSDTDNEWFSN